MIGSVDVVYDMMMLNLCMWVGRLVSGIVWLLKCLVSCWLCLVVWFVMMSLCGFCVVKCVVYSLIILFVLMNSMC